MEHNYGLIGKNISYSFSAGYFTRKFESLGLENHSYRNYHLDQIEQIKSILTDTPGLKGLNVTIPYKEAVMPYLDAIDPEAAAIGAVNTIAFQNGKTCGYNTDTYGFQISVTPLIGNNVQKALVLGTGGASKAIVYTLRKMGLAVTLVSRASGKNSLTYQDLDAAVMSDHQLIVNCTPLGTFPNITDKPEIPYILLTKNHVLYDLVYNPKETAFLKEGRLKGCSVLNGYEMLVHQAEKAWKIWNS
ncbi:shikimate dehydrogenase [Robertkochia marina]|uniref:Shikimate dehydrogenase n=1 Tax=Robertkochia marina TaxID=1227945 RepID=A0A4S3M0N0_9FLAO|nr:shikimate dehydrogenase [Robertkochia marina]THD66557.1 shikimate dehydrogenase [Robertkochia marina]TRZ45604.1 shikimate dehydrogenase [Robertkochia marina]